jgi:hypothetical protein
MQVQVSRRCCAAKDVSIITTGYRDSGDDYPEKK